MVPLLPIHLVELASVQHGALLGTQVTAVLDDRRLGLLVRNGTLIRLWRNAYAVPGTIPSNLTRLEAARLTLSREVTACLHTAAEVYGFDLMADPRTHVLAVQNWSRKLPELVHHRISPVRPPVVMGGRSLTDLAETAVRVACVEKDPGKALAVLDSALHRTSLDPKSLTEVAADLRIHGIRLVRELAPLADGRAESPGESWLRWVCIEAALPTPTPQVVVTLNDGRRRRIDLGWEDRKVGCEYEGVEFHTGKALTKDRSRYNALGRVGWLLQGVTSSMIWYERSALVADISSMLAERS